jgi:hypothetical protein
LLEAKEEMTQNKRKQSRTMLKDITLKEESLLLSGRVRSHLDLGTVCVTGKKEFLERTNRLISFDTTRTA